MLSIRKCVQCGKTYDTISGDEKTICPLCAGDLSGCEEITEDNVYLKDFRSFSDEPIPANTLRTDLKGRKRDEKMAPSVSEGLSQDFFKKPTSQFNTAIISDSDELEIELLKLDLSQFKDVYPIIPIDTPPAQNEQKKKKSSLQTQKIKANKTPYNPYIDL